MVIAVSMVLMPLLISLVINLLVRIFGDPALTGQGVITLTAMLGQELTLLWLTVGVVLSSGWQLSAIGLTLRRWPKHLLVGVTGGIGLLIINFVGDVFSVWAFEIFFSAEQVQALLEQENSVLTQLLHPSQPTWQVIALVLLVGVLAPVVEEVFFRGYAYSVFRTKWGVAAAAAVSSMLFAVVHLYVIHFFPIYLLGLVLCYLYERTNSLLPSIVAHSVMNLLVAWLIYTQGVA